jgi:hypothetical protein
MEEIRRMVVEGANHRVSQTSNCRFYIIEGETVDSINGLQLFMNRICGLCKYFIFCGNTEVTATL